MKLPNTKTFEILALTLVCHDDAFQAMLLCDPSNRYDDKKHIIQVKIHHALEASNASPQLFNTWKKEVNDYWTKVNWCALPTSQTGNYNGHVEARPLVAQMDINNQTVSHLVQKFTLVEADLSTVRAQNKEMREEIADLKNQIEGLSNTLQNSFKQLSSNVNFIAQHINAGIRHGDNDNHVGRWSPIHYSVFT